MKMEDVLAVYEKPYNPDEPVVCLDEKPVSLHADARLPPPAEPGKVLRRENELIRDSLNIHCRKPLVDCFGEERGGRL